MVSAFVYLPLEGPRRIVLFLWDVVLVAACISFPFVPDPGPVLLILNLQLIITIAGSVSIMALNLRNVGNPTLRQALAAFLWISAAFLIFLMLDMVITRLSIRSLAFLDGLSLPVYLLSLNIGSFLFAGRFLNSDPLLEGGRLTESCRAGFGLTNRETELIERLLDGSTNQDLADALHISRKTVENHLYNIFQKMQVKNRVQLIAALRVWNRET
jgi:DNA-binding CsgD family transcriptional regulator